MQIYHLADQPADSPVPIILVRALRGRRWDKSRQSDIQRDTNILISVHHTVFRLVANNNKIH